MSTVIGSDIILLKSAARFAATGTNYTAPFKDAWRYTEGVFVLKASQGAGQYTNETLDVWVMSYDTYNLYWHIIGQFTQITNAEVTQYGRIERPYGLGRWLSCAWAIANAVEAEAYTFGVSGFVK